MITTNDEKLYEKLLQLRTHGIVKDEEKYKNSPAFASGLDETQYSLLDTQYTILTTRYNITIQFNQTSHNYICLHGFFAFPGPGLNGLRFLGQGPRVGP